ncbi:MAG: cysJ 2 [Akkermansiaceae bacterium]|nr:cysJ 2 [Akkermansiaceae bacterium]
MAVMNLPVIPENAPFDQSQRMWLNGYLAGLFSGGNGGGATPPPAKKDLGLLLFLYGTQTGGAETLARKFSGQARKLGFTASAAGMDTFGDIDFSKQTRLAIITSTYGEGDMPDNAQAFWDFLSSAEAPALGHLEFSVLALGDTNYQLFCEAGKKFDARLEELGAKRVAARIDCDVDFEQPAAQWYQSLVSCFAGSESPATGSADQGDTAEVVPYGKSRPFPAKLKINRLLNRDGSTKETRHIEIKLDGSGLEYEAGDALGVLPRNCPDFVAEILEAAGLNGSEMVATSESAQAPLRTALIEVYDLKPFLTALPAAGTKAVTLVEPLRRLQPRLYSISSSPKAHPGEVHLTVSVVRYELEQRQRKGVCSTFLADHEMRAGEDFAVPVFVHHSPHFRLPSDLSKPVIMVGPGTGIAPFRSFLEERRATNASGRNWLFFGDQKSATDFLYEDELSSMFSDGHLTRLALAFSRDQQEKIYVQDRMLEHAAELWQWFEDGAHFYVCGDASRMAKDVDAALHQIASQAGGLADAAASAWVAGLKKQKRYLRDVY